MANDILGDGLRELESPLYNEALQQFNRVADLIDLDPNIASGSFGTVQCFQSFRGLVPQIPVFWDAPPSARSPLVHC